MERGGLKTRAWSLYRGILAIEGPVLFDTLYSSRRKVYAIGGPVCPRE